MLEKLSFSSRTTEVGAALTRMINAYNNTSLNSDPHLAELFTGLTSDSTRLTQSINRAKAISQLDEKDELRDDKIRSLYYLLQGFSHHPDQTIKDAAVQLLAVFDRYGLSVIRESYATESALVNSLLTDLADVALEPSITALSGCAELIAELKAAQEDFENIRTAYETEKGSESTLESATVIKKEVVRTINNQLVVYLRAMQMVNDATYGDFTRTIGEIIDDNNETVKRRLNKTEPAA